MHTSVINLFLILKNIKKIIIYRQLNSMSEFLTSSSFAALLKFEEKNSENVL